MADGRVFGSAADLPQVELKIPIICVLQQRECVVDTGSLGSSCSVTYAVGAVASISQPAL